MRKPSLLVHKVRHLLNESDISLKQISKDISVSQPWLSAIKRGENRAYDCRLIEELYIYLSGESL